MNLNYAGGYTVQVLNIGYRECPHPPLGFMKMRKLREDLALIQVPYKVLFFLNTRIIQCIVLILNKTINESFNNIGKGRGKRTEGRQDWLKGDWNLREM